MKTKINQKHEAAIKLLRNAYETGVRSTMRKDEVIFFVEGINGNLLRGIVKNYAEFSNLGWYAGRNGGLWIREATMNGGAA